jgi:hypothetical protein
MGISYFLIRVAYKKIMSTSGTTDNWSLKKSNKIFEIEIYRATKGIKAINRARLIASANFLWFFAHTPLLFVERIRPCGLMNFFKISISL